MKASRFFPRNLLEAGWKYKCIAFYAFYLGLLPFLLPDLSAPLSYTNSALPKAPLLLIWVFFPTSRMTKRYNRNNKTTATIGNCISFISIHFGCLRPSKIFCNLETALWHSVWNSPCCDWTSVMPNSPRHEAVAGSCPAGATSLRNHLPQRRKLRRLLPRRFRPCHWREVLEQTIPPLCYHSVSSSK